MVFSLLVFPTAASSTPLERQLYLIPIRFSTASNQFNRLIGRRQRQLREPLGPGKVSHHFSQFTNLSMQLRSTSEKRASQPGGREQFWRGSAASGVLGRRTTSYGSLLTITRRLNSLLTHQGTGGKRNRKRSTRKSKSGALVSSRTPFQPASSISNTPAQ